MNELPPELPASCRESDWDADSLFRRSDWRIELHEPEIRELWDAVDARRETGIPLDSIPPDSISPLKASLPALGPILTRMQHDLESGSGVALIRGLDLAGKSDEQARWLFWVLAQQIGTPVSQTAAGDRMFDVRDAGLPDGDPRVRGPNTRRRLTFHTDRCDVIGFLCVRDALEGGENHIISSPRLYRRARAERPDLCRVLMDSFWYQRHNVDRGNDQAYCQQPVFSMQDGFFAANLMRVLIERAHSSDDVPNLTAEQQEALNYLEQLAEDDSLFVSIRQRPGDMLFLNNWVTLHRRTEFIDDPDPDRKRLLLRVWLSVPNSRPLDARFAANYGSTAAGSLRGGMRPT